ncbi:hypothetical protein Tco_1195915 [Tanacetum coccineum]
MVDNANQMSRRINRKEGEGGECGRTEVRGCGLRWLGVTATYVFDLLGVLLCKRETPDWTGLAKGLHAGQQTGKETGGYIWPLDWANV